MKGKSNMSFDRNTDYVKNENNNKYKRSQAIAKSVRESETKNIREENAEIRPTTFSPEPRSRNFRAKKQYMMLNFYPEEKRKLKRLANMNGVSASQYIENFLATQDDPGPEWD